MSAETQLSFKFSNCADPTLPQSTLTHTPGKKYTHVCSVLQDPITEDSCRKTLGCLKAALWDFLHMSLWAHRDPIKSLLSEQRSEVTRPVTSSYDGKSHPISWRHAGNSDIFHVTNTSKSRSKRYNRFNFKRLVCASRCNLTSVQCCSNRWAPVQIKPVKEPQCLMASEYKRQLEQNSKINKMGSFCDTILKRKSLTWMHFAQCCILRWLIKSHLKTKQQHGLN